MLLHWQLILEREVMDHFKAPLNKIDLGKALLFHFPNRVSYSLPMVLLSLSFSFTRESHNTDCGFVIVKAGVLENLLFQHLFIVAIVKLDSEAIWDRALSLDFMESDIKYHEADLLEILFVSYCLGLFP